MSREDVMTTPLDLLLPYQRRWFDDASRFKIGLWARQTGKSFACAAEGVRDCMANPGTLWVVLSAGERQALEFLEKVKRWAQLWDFVIQDYLEERDTPQSVLKSAEVRFPNGARFLGLPANPNTARGYSGNLILDEFAFHENPDAIWRGIYPSISNPLVRHYMLRIVSTANGRTNKFYDLWTKGEAYSKHKVTIHDAAAAGLGVNVEELKAGLDDPDGWAQEYECEFIDSTSVLFPYELLAACESELASEIGEHAQPSHLADSYLGVDTGRRRDLTVISHLQKPKGNDVLWTREMRVLEKMPFREQHEIIAQMIRRTGARRVAMDSTGLGMQLAEDLAREFPGKIEECTFTPTLKGEIFMGLRRQFDDRLLRIPVSRTLREDLHAMQKVVSQSGQVRYLAPQTDDGHSDRATALALAVRAATTRPVEVTLTLI